MVNTLAQLRQEIADAGKAMYDKGWIAACDGNISVRLPQGQILCTPAGVCKGRLCPEDLIVCTPEGHKVEGEREPSSELGMHLAIYRIRPDVGAVLHAHPPTATGFAAAGRALDLALLPEVIVGLGTVPLAAYGLPGTPALAESMSPYIPEHDAILMANHGCVTCGAELQQAFFRMDTVEHLARVTLVAELLGGAKPLPGAEVRKLFESRARYGVRSRTSMQPGSPLVAEDLQPQTEKLQFTREELLDVFEEALRARGVLA